MDKLGELKKKIYIENTIKLGTVIQYSLSPNKFDIS